MSSVVEQKVAKRSRHFTRVFLDFVVASTSCFSFCFFRREAHSILLLFSNQNQNSIKTVQFSFILQRKAVASLILIAIFDEGEAKTAKRSILKISSQS